MFQGLLRPLASHTLLRDLTGLARPREMLGAWISAPRQPQRICIDRCSLDTSLLLSEDLGFLLTRCSRVVLRAGTRPLALAAGTIICWRALQVATGTPYLPGLTRMQTLFPGMRLTPEGFLVRLPGESPEQVLALCIQEGVQVRSSRIVYQFGTNSRRELR